MENNVCPICKQTIEDGVEATVCPNCGKTYHTECWNKNGGCENPECAEKPNPESEAPEQIPTEANNEATENPEATPQENNIKSKIGILKKWWIWAITGVIVLSIVLISTCSKTDNARAVIQQIKMVTEDVDACSDSLIESVEEQYDALTDKEKKQINNYDDLLDARNECDELIADRVENQIKALSSDSGIDSIERVFSKYNDLTDNQKKYVLNYKTLVQLEEDYYDEFVTAAETAISSIDYDGGEITDEQLKAIDEAVAACEEVPNDYQKNITNYKVLLKAISDKDAYYIENAQALIDKAIKDNKGFEKAEKVYNELSDEAKIKINNYDKFSELYTEYKNKPPVKILSYRVGENLIGNPEIYISAKNVSGKIIKSFTFAFFAWDKNGLPQKIDYSDYYQLLTYDHAINVGEKTANNCCWRFHGIYDKSIIQQAVIVIRDVEYFDGTTWENPNYGTLFDKYCQQLLEKGDSNIAKRG